MQVDVVQDFIRDSFVEAFSGWTAVVVDESERAAVWSRLAEQPNILQGVGRVW